MGTVPAANMCMGVASDEGLISCKDVCWCELPAAELSPLFRRWVVGGGAAKNWGQPWRSYVLFAKYILAVRRGQSPIFC